MKSSAESHSKRPRKTKASLKQPFNPIHGVTNKKTSKLANWRLSPKEESFLVNWCLNKEASTRPLSKAQITKMAIIVLVKGGDFTPISYH